MSADQEITRNGVLPEVVDTLREHLRKQGVVPLVLAGESPHLEGIWGASSAAILAAMADLAADFNILVLTPSQKSAERFQEDFATFRDERMLFFPWTSLEMQKYDTSQETMDAFIPDATVGERLQVLKTLQACGEDRSRRALVVASIQSLLRPCPRPEVLREESLKIEKGQTVTMESLTGWLVDHGFQNTSAVRFPGEFFVRGGLLDIYGMEMDAPVRIEFFGDEVDSLREFDIETQRSNRSLESMEVTSFLSLFRKDEKDDCVSFVKYLPKNSFVFLLEPEEIPVQAKQFYQSRERAAELYTNEEVLRDVLAVPFVSASTLGGGAFGRTFSLSVETVERFSGDFSKVKDELEKYGGNQDVYLLCPNEQERKRLTTLFESTRLAKMGRLNVRMGNVTQGFRLVDSRQLVLTSDALFNREEIYRGTHRKTTKVIDSFSELREGDYVVHVSHGIAVYRGLKLLEPASKQKAQASGGAEEHLVLEFRDKVVVYVPVSKIALIQKYICGGGTRPKLSVYGGRAWEKQKNAVTAAVRDLAVEMIEIQALRKSRPGIAFPTKTSLQDSFDGMFPFTETPDQKTAIEAIRHDMSQSRPMDRLLCGDVGFGKTEVAMRAAFTAVEAGYQVAVLVPTTVLAEQHYRTFCERMASFPVMVGVLSRFSTPAEQQNTLQRLKDGNLDILIGTHRLASADVKFNNLGLIIIDEEQRFGVEIKESLKKLRSTVDVLTMTATPIPRTLHMSLLGIRDISSLETPPNERMAVETHVTRFQGTLVKNAIRRELEREGQIFFIHNRVQDIDDVAAKLRELVPEARIRVGHAQMNEHELESVMVDFIRHRCDILISTTIVENGLDIPNANTIFIDEANRYGLSDLHQLRGRVGRFRHHAYCYMLVKEKARLTDQATRRLKAIEEFSHLGSGFSIAMRDLEIRGTGNILGTDQSGQIAVVGYEMYCDLLENAVRRLQKLPPRETVDVDVDLPVVAYIPHEYVPDMRVKIDLYRRLSRLTRVEHLADFANELKDRFGRIPEPFWRLLLLFRVRILAHQWLIYAIRREENYIVLHFYSKKAIEPLVKLGIGRKKFHLRIADESSAYLPMDEWTANSPPESDKMLKYVEMLLQER